MATLVARCKHFELSQCFLFNTVRSGLIRTDETGAGTGGAHRARIHTPPHLSLSPSSRE